MNNIEREAIILNSAWDMIDDMVNWAMFTKMDSDSPTSLLFETRKHSRLFIILLGDFLSEVRAFKGEPIPLGLLAPPSGARPSDLTFLFHLRQVCADPQLASGAEALGQAVEAFSNWLETEFVLPDVNLSSIDVVADLRMARLRYIKMCGDIAKHNLARLATNVKHLRALLETAGHPISEQQAYLAVDDFFEWFHDNIFNYHASQIGEFLNNIRWAMYDYLQPEFRRSWHLTGKVIHEMPMYAYNVPEDITEPVARAMYWDLMNRSRRQPYMPRFVISDILKQRY